MPLKERLNDEREDVCAEGMDDLDLAYLKELTDCGIHESLIEQFQSIVQEMNEEKEIS